LRLGVGEIRRIAPLLSPSLREARPKNRPSWRIQKKMDFSRTVHKKEASF